MRGPASEAGSLLGDALAPLSTTGRRFGDAAASARTTALGSRTPSRASKSPARAAARKAAARRRCRSRSASGSFTPAWIRRRARLASCRVASGERPTTSATCSNGTWNVSCSTKAIRSAGASLVEKHEHGRTTESASRASCSGSGAGPIRSGTTEGSSRRAGRGSQHVEADVAHDRREPRTQVLQHGVVDAAEADPGLLNRVLRLRGRAEEAVGDAVQVTALLLEPLGCGQTRQRSRGSGCRGGSTMLTPLSQGPDPAGAVARGPPRRCPSH
jgi:hypothetical protein